MDTDQFPRRIALVGLMGCGKSRVGERLARRLGYPFADLDAEIERHAGRTVSALFAAEGESGFRERESALLASLAAAEGNMVLACGGGVVLQEANRRRLREAFVTLWIDAPLDVLARRVEGSRSRPLLAGRSALDVLAEQDAARRGFYVEVSRHRLFTVSEEPPEARVTEILALLGAAPSS
jgi:shikimate kinase